MANTRTKTKNTTNMSDSSDKAHIAKHFLFAAMQGAISLGHSQEKLLSRADISSDVLFQQEAITELQLTNMVKTVWRLTQDEFMGFTDRPCYSGTFALMAEHCLSATTLGAMLTRSAHFFRVICPQLIISIEQGSETGCEINTEKNTEKNNRVFFTIHIIDGEKDQAHFFQEFLLLMWQRFSCWLVNQQIPFNSTHFSYTPPKHVQHYDAMFPCQHYFKQRLCGFTFHEKYLQLPMVRSQGELTHFLATSPAYILRRPHQDHRLRTQIKYFLAQSSFVTMPSLAQVGVKFNLTPRSISRKLKEEGATFSQIKDELRLNYAKKLLSTEHLNIGKISELVGFADVVSFCRAFKRWTGKSPTLWRR